MNTFDLIIIGSGPAGYIGAMKAAQLGMRVALVEKEKYLGGTCLNVGCIPSKALLHSTEMYHYLKDRGSSHGIECEDLRANISLLMQRKQGVVDKLRKGIDYWMSSKKITVIYGEGTLVQGGVRVGDTVYVAKHIMIATGSAPIELPFLKFDKNKIISSNEAINLDTVPKRMVVIGGGAIGLELGCVWSRLGSEVTVVEYMPQIAPSFDQEIARLAERILAKQGLVFSLGVTIKGVSKEEGKVFLIGQKNGSEVRFEADTVLVAVGRRPYTDNLGLEAMGVKLDDKKRIEVNEYFQTNIQGIYAVGDVIQGPMLAHKAEAEAVACVERIAGQAGSVNYATIPGVIYTDPEIACVGLSEEEAKTKNIEYKVTKTSMSANGRAIASDSSEGMVKVIACAQTDKILGVHMVAKGASEIISTAVTHMTYGGSAEDMARTVLAHPTISESLRHNGF
jgi:dihydrolipoamide dehydrogenase